MAVGAGAPGSQHRLGLGARVHLEKAPVEVEVVDLHLRKVASLPGVELGPQSLADPAGGRLGHLGVLAEDLGQHGLDVPVRQPPAPSRR